MPGRTPLVVAVVGTDHHPFDRLVRWVDAWAADRPVRVVVQYGSARPPRHAEGHRVLPGAELRAFLTEADAVVCHGGPGTIAAAREAGRSPIVLARRPELGEHVDDHQIRFVGRLAAQGVVEAPVDRTALYAALDRAVTPSSMSAPSRVAEAPPEEARETSMRFASVVDALLRPDPADLRVLFVAGWGRSGSTLLARMLGQVPGFFSAGEIREIWHRGLVEDRLCGCGEPFSACEVWQQVGESAFGGWDHLDIGEVLRLRGRLERLWSPPRVLAGSWSPELDRDVARYAGYLGRLYRGIRDVTGASVIVDSSKIVTYALALRRVPRIDLRAVHLVRDPRGVVRSWQKALVRADGGGHDAMHRYGVAAACGRYVAYNGLAHGLRGLGVAYHRLRYEDLLEAPRAQLTRVLTFAGAPAAPEDLAFIGDGVADLGMHHTVDGNPMRLEHGEVALRLDDAWRTELSARDRRMVAALTSPLLTHYGYRIESR